MNAALMMILLDDDSIQMDPNDVFDSGNDDTPY